MNVLLEPFSYEYMLNAMWVSAMVGGLCAFLSCYLMLRLVADWRCAVALYCPGVAGAYMLGLPFSLGAFFSGGLAAGSMLFLNQLTRLKEDAIIGLIFSSFLARAVYGVIEPDIREHSDHRLGNILAIDPADILQLTIIGILSIIVCFFKWKDLMVLFRRESRPCYWIASGQIKNPLLHPAVGFDRCGAANGWCLSGDLSGGDSRCNSMVVNRSFSRLLMIAVTIGSVTSFLGAWVSYFLDGATGGIIVVAQTLLFLLAFVFAPTHGLLANRRRAHKALEDRS